jgi:hypothetical protein
MGSTLVLSGGAANTKTLKELLTQVGHGFVVGDVLRLNTSNGKYVKAKAERSCFGRSFLSCHVFVWRNCGRTHKQSS